MGGRALAKQALRGRNSGTYTFGKLFPESSFQFSHTSTIKNRNEFLSQQVLQMKQIAFDNYMSWDLQNSLDRFDTIPIRIEFK